MKTRKKQHNKKKHNHHNHHNHNDVSHCMKKQNKTKTIKLGCSPNVNHGKDYTCYNSSSLIKLRDLWNGRHPDLLIESNDDIEIWKSLKPQKTPKNIIVKNATLLAAIKKIIVNIY